jgi:RND superfamily putative drug exporter
LRSVAGTAIPLLTAVLGVATGLALIDLLGLAADVPTVAPTLATMIGLGVGIDYALFQVVRVRRLLRDGVPLRDAVIRSGASSGHAVVFAGGTVAVALGGLVLAGIGFVTALGWTSALVVAVSVAAAVTAVPALVALLGRRLASNVGSPAGGLFDRLVGAPVVARPRTALVAGLALVLALGAPVLALQLGQTDGGDAPRSTQTRQYADIVAAGFGPGANGPLTVVAAPGTSDTAVEDFARQIRETPGVASVSPPRPAGEGATALTVTPQTAPGDPATADLVQRLRADAGAGIHVGGATAVRVDLGARITERLPAVLAAVIALGAVLLLVQFRSVLVALKAVAMNVISIGAGYGAVVLVVQEGLGADPIGLDGPVPIDAYVPLMLFVVLFGLSMDYEVFLLTAIREHWTSPTGGRDAVRRGLADTAGVVTTAAAVMLAVFASFLLHPDPVVKTFALGMAVAVLVDATIVRCLLVPAAMVLMGRWNWWLPRPLARLLPASAGESLHEGNSR